MNFSEIVERAKGHVEEIYHRHENPALVYHNVKHTELVVHHAISLANHHPLSEEQRFIIQIAAWFHDVGYLFDVSAHERAGAAEAARFLFALNTPQHIINEVEGAVMATRMPQKASSLVEKIVCDADLYHLGTEDFNEINKLVRKEKSLMYPNSFSKEEWLKRTIAMFEYHEFQTEYCQKHLGMQKQKNLDKLRQKLKTPVDFTPAATAIETSLSKNKEKKGKKKNSEMAAEEKAEKPSRGIETMFRISSGNHQRLSDMADNKANIIITVNSIILSAILSFLIRKLDSEEYLAVPTYIIIVVSLLAIIFAILATRPAITKGEFSQSEVDEKKANLLFFGNFHNESLTKYSSAMQSVMNDKEHLYQMLIRDLHSQGVVLGKKYRLLRISYNIFMYGLVIAVLAFLTVSIVFA